MNLQSFERLIITKYRKSLWAPFKNALESYALLEAGSKIAICISGGKDSLLLAKLFQQLSREQSLELHFLAMDPGYLPENRQLLERNLELLGIPATIVNSDVFEASLRIDGETPCYWCARMRRGVLYKEAKALGCDVIALGHHYDDVIETTLMNVLHHGNVSTMLPKVHSQEQLGMAVIRPLYHIREKDIIRLMKAGGIEPMNCSCPIMEKRHDAVRKETKKLIASLSESYPQVAASIFAAPFHVKSHYVMKIESD